MGTTLSRYARLRARLSHDCLLLAALLAEQIKNATSVGFFSCFFWDLKWNMKDLGIRS